jgi:hypothetical protein
VVECGDLFGLSGELLSELDVELGWVLREVRKLVQIFKLIRINKIF